MWSGWSQLSKPSDWQYFVCWSGLQRFPDCLQKDFSFVAPKRLHPPPLLGLLGDSGSLACSFSPPSLPSHPSSPTFVFYSQLSLSLNLKCYVSLCLTTESKFENVAFYGYSLQRGWSKTWISVTHKHKAAVFLEFLYVSYKKATFIYKGKEDLHFYHNDSWVFLSVCWPENSWTAESDKGETSVLSMIYFCRG